MVSGFKAHRPRMCGSKCFAKMNLSELKYVFVMW